MALSYYMDEHVPRPITVGLRLRHVDVVTAQEDAHRSVDDGLLLERAWTIGRVMVSFDADMLREAARRQARREALAGLVFAHPTQISVGQCVRDLEIIAKVGTQDDLSGYVLFLPL